jgi:FkbM family methyltransferase
MRDRISDRLIRVYEQATAQGLLNRPRPRRAYEWTYFAYKRLIEAGPVDGLHDLVARGSTVVDVGANIGFFSMLFARWVGPTGHVIAIEPETRNIESLRRRVARGGLSDVVTCVQAAAADRSGQLRLARTPGHPGDHHLAENGEPIAAVTLDELTATDMRPVTLVKVDVQGAETMVLTGARRMIAAHRPAVFVELHEPSLARLGSSRRELLDLLLSLGYGAHALTSDGIRDRLEPNTLLAQSATGYIDVLFLPVSHSLPTPHGDVSEHRE